MPCSLPLEDTRTARKRTLPPSPNEGVAQKKPRQLKIETFLSSTNNLVSKNDYPLSAPVYAEISPNSAAALHPTSLKNGTGLSCPPKDESGQPGKNTPVRHAKCEVAKYLLEHLSEMCYISAESLIYLLGCINKIESQLQDILKTLAPPKGSVLPRYEKESLLSAAPLKNPWGNATLGPDQKVSRSYQPHQLVPNVPSVDAQRWCNKGRILESLSALLDFHIPFADLDYFYFLPSLPNYKRIFLSFHSPMPPRKIFSAVQFFRFYGLFPSRVFRDLSLRTLFKGKPVLKSTLQKPRTNNLLPPQCNSQEDDQNIQQDDLIALKNKLLDLLAPFRLNSIGTTPPSLLASENLLDTDAFLQPSVQNIPQPPRPLHRCFTNLDPPTPLPSESQRDVSDSDSINQEIAPDEPEGPLTDTSSQEVIFWESGKDGSPGEDSNEPHGPSGGDQGPSLARLATGPYSGTSSSTGASSLTQTSFSGLRPSLMTNEAPDLRPGAILLNDPHFDRFTNFLLSDSSEMT